MGMVFASVICTFAAYIFGLSIESVPTNDIPGFGLALAVTVMGGFIMFQLTRKKEGD